MAWTAVLKVVGQVRKINHIVLAMVSMLGYILMVSNVLLDESIVFSVQCN